MRSFFRDASVPLQPLVQTNFVRDAIGSMEPQPKKRLKSSDERSLELMSLGRASFVSKSGIANLLNTIKKEDLPATYDISAQFRAKKQVCQWPPTSTITSCRIFSKRMKKGLKWSRLPTNFLRHEMLQMGWNHLCER